MLRARQQHAAAWLALVVAACCCGWLPLTAAPEPPPAQDHPPAAAAVPNFCEKLASSANALTRGEKLYRKGISTRQAVYLEAALLCFDHAHARRRRPSSSSSSFSPSAAAASSGGDDGVGSKKKESRAADGRPSRRGGARQDSAAAARTHFYQGATLAQLGRRIEAVAHYRRSVELEANAGASENLGGLLGELGRWREAAKHFEASVAKSATVRSLTGLGRAYFHAGRPEEAIQALKRAAKDLDDASDDPRAPYELGRGIELLGGSKFGTIRDSEIWLAEAQSRALRAWWARGPAPPCPGRLVRGWDGGNVGFKRVVEFLLDDDDEGNKDGGETGAMYSRRGTRFFPDRDVLIARVDGAIVSGNDAVVTDDRCNVYEPYLGPHVAWHRNLPDPTYVNSVGPLPVVPSANGRADDPFLENGGRRDASERVQGGTSRGGQSDGQQVEGDGSLTKKSVGGAQTENLAPADGEGGGPVLLGNKTTKDIDEALLLVATFGVGYYHWMLEILPRLLVARQHFLSSDASTASSLPPILLASDVGGKGLKTFMRQSLELLQVPSEQIIEYAVKPATDEPSAFVDPPRLRVGKLWVVDWKNQKQPRDDPKGVRDTDEDGTAISSGNAADHVVGRTGLTETLVDGSRVPFRTSLHLPARAALKLLRTALRSSLPHHLLSRPPHVLYVARRSVTTTRRLSSAADARLVEILKRATMGRMRVEVFSDDPSPAFGRSMQMFATASVVVGLHGAGLANAVACSPGTTIVELTLPEEHGMYYEHLAAALELNYWGVPVGGGAPPSPAAAAMPDRRQKLLVSDGDGSVADSRAAATLDKEGVAAGAPAASIAEPMPPYVSTEIELPDGLEDAIVSSINAIGRSKDRQPAEVSDARRRAKEEKTEL